MTTESNNLLQFFDHYVVARLLITHTHRFIKTEETNALCRSGVGGPWGRSLFYNCQQLRREFHQSTMEGEGRVSWMKYGSLLPLLVLLLALWFRFPQNAVLDDRLDAVLSSLLRAERKVGMNTVARPRVAIGKLKWCKLSLFFFYFKLAQCFVSSLMIHYGRNE